MPKIAPKKEAAKALIIMHIVLVCITNPSFTAEDAMIMVRLNIAPIISALKRILESLALAAPKAPRKQPITMPAKTIIPALRSDIRLL